MGSSDGAVIFMGKDTPRRIVCPYLRSGCSLFPFFAMPPMAVNAPPLGMGREGAAVSKKCQSSHGDDNGDHISHTSARYKKVHPDDNQYNRPHAEYRPPVEMDDIQVIQQQDPPHK